MLYLKSFTFLTDGEEFDIIINIKEKMLQFVLSV